MNIKRILLILFLFLSFTLFGLYRYDVYQDQQKIFVYSEELHLFEKRSFTEQDKFETIPAGQPVKILRQRFGKDSIEVYIEVNGKRGWVTSMKSTFQVLNESHK